MPILKCHLGLYQEQFSQNNRLVYQTAEKPEKNVEAQQQPSEYPDKSASFLGDYEKDMLELGKAIDSENPENAAKDLKNFFAENLGTSTDKVWQYLKEQNCQTTALVESFPRFYASNKVGEKEINIDQFFKPFEIKLKPTPAYKHWEQMRGKMLEEIRAKWQALLDEVSNRPSNVG